MTDSKERLKAKRLLIQATEKKHQAHFNGNRLEADRWSKVTESLSKALGDENIVGASDGPSTHFETE